MADVASLVNGVSELVQIPSVNPLQSHDPALAGERRLAEHLANRAEDLGADVELDNVVDDRPNLIAKFEGERPDTIVIDVHLDTVAVGHMTDDPFDGRVENDRVYGRGSVDTKATFAIVIDVLSQLRNDGRRPGPTVHLVGTVSEEMGGLLGARHLASRLQHDGHHIDRMIIAEPTMCAPVHGHKGGVGLEICVHGHAAHSSRPELGANAIAAAARI
ncbi:MAG: M20/M25/M40 family metallo-hydrolase, partial [Actinomycetota bacterium]|nr:M20/M25/M40 family metallo-hydrolase [Actinomycetota bacterium]